MLDSYFSQLKVNRKPKKRKGRGIAANQGKTCGRGQKGQKARSKVRIGFEGGQTPLYRRLPKRGFNNFNKKEVTIIQSSLINQNFSTGQSITLENLKTTNLIPSHVKRVKILNNADLNKDLSFSEDIKISKSLIKK
ncbi:50S ribosomal protein L15 [Mycoplasma sp. SG1]|uniref:50S ribosomal protein L15 n=1 Tax=Mycoplasma sp. SG1 TaxID=2810348 RepID=UPI002024A2E2|nr:50S ribosomal protein L15 [Mycoplasma sp. SG1]URM52908.1 50S ribosomal protein L15 [Mycoplasma sp. SG1]